MEILHLILAGVSICNQKILAMIQQFFQLDLSSKAFVVKELGKMTP